MNTQHHEGRCTSPAESVPTGFCRKVAEALGTLKEELTEKYERSLPGRAYFVRELIEEAETLAWETSFPHLFLPDFAEARLAEVVESLQPVLARAA